MDGPGRGICGTDGRCDLSSADGTRLRSGGPRVSHVADRPDQHLGARKPWGPPHGSPVDGSISRKGSTRPPKNESDEVEKRGSLRE